jgi:hypothetical protein
VLNNPEISKIKKEHSNYVRILAVIGVIGYTESTNRPYKNYSFFVSLSNIALGDESG